MVVSLDARVIASTVIAACFAYPNRFASEVYGATGPADARPTVRANHFFMLSLAILSLAMPSSFFIVSLAMLSLAIESFFIESFAILSLDMVSFFISSAAYAAGASGARAKP